MPIKQAAKKYMRVTDRKNQKNRKITGVFRNAIKKTRESIQKNNIKDAQNWLKQAIKGLDKATEKNVIKKNTASRTKSRLNKSVKEAVLAEKK